MENFLASRPNIAKPGIQPKTTANLFASLANRTTVRPAHAPAMEKLPLPDASETPSHGHEPQIELVRENGAVQRIVVVCKCGERVELDCVY